MFSPPLRLSRLVRAAKKFLVSACVVLAYLAFVIQQQYADPAVSATSVAVALSPAASVTVPVAASAATAPAANTAHAAATSTAAPLAAPTASPIPSGPYKDGQYTGSVADAYWGGVQVEAIIQHGNLTDVKFLDYPHDRRTSVRINNVAVPYLRTEAIQAQTARVHIITGATLTSLAFVESLTSALQTAK